MKKAIIDFQVIENICLSPLYSLIRLTPEGGVPLPECLPGQFVQIAVEGSKTTFLRRPISICNVDRDANELWLLIRLAGAGTAALLDSREGDVMNIIMPLGNGFSLPENKSQSILLIGGGVGVAPLLLLGRELKSKGYVPKFLLGARSSEDLLLLDEFRKVGETFISTDNGTAGEKGVITMNSVLTDHWDRIYCCGPSPMMKAVAKKAREIGAECEVSLENMMACGLGACLCCVEKTVKGNVCVCTEGPVFNINDLTW